MVQAAIDFSGDQLRDAGISRVLRNEREQWRSGVLTLIKAQVDEFTADSLRHEWSQLGGGEPHHPNAWGAILRTAHTQGLIFKTGSYVKADHAAAHSRMIPVWSRWPSLDLG